jgi:tRNA 2-thiouridine synthesizing protein A
MNRVDQFQVTERWDAGDVGCGQLIVGVRSRLGGMQAGELLELTTQNAGAPLDLPAWCRMVGHELISAHHPVYVIRKLNR